MRHLTCWSGVALLLLCLCRCETNASFTANAGEKLLPTQKTAALSDGPTNTPSPQIVLFIGEDMSCSTKALQKLKNEDLLALSDALLAKDYAGQVYFRTIDGETGTKYEGIQLKAKKVTKANPTQVEILTVAKENKKIKAENTTRLAGFIEKCQKQMGAPCKLVTDLNAFLSIAKSVFDAPFPGGETPKKVLFINTDGKQDTKADKKLKHGLFPSDPVKIHISGWGDKSPKPTGPLFYGLPSQAVGNIISQL